MPDFSKLTERQREIYDFIKEKIESRGYGPTVREIGEAFKIQSPNGVMCHLNALVAKGLILRQERSARAIQLVDHRRPGVDLPMLGLVAAGEPMAASDQDERLNFGELFGGPNHFALRVRGRSMIEDHIQDGDYVVIRKQNVAENGERVVAMIDNEVTLKRFHREKDAVRLDPANSEMGPIHVDPHSDAQILGVLVGVLRRC
ncbi:MAG TPA: transcriptional repressor LexA [Gemmataceae bacterium]|nr:transcriptional repressor LexA [Gemmataceae bacterium]